MNGPVAVDFETYYDTKGCSVKDLGPEAYTRHPDFDAYLVALHGDGVSYSGPLEGAPWEAIKDRDWISHNACFEQAVVRWGRARGKIPKDCYPRAHWLDTTAIPAYEQVMRNLKDAAGFLLGEEVSKATRASMAGRRFESLKDDKRQALIEYAKRDAELAWRLYKEHKNKLPEEEWLLSALTNESCMHGCQLDLDALKKGWEKMAVIRDRLVGQLPWADGTHEGALAQAALKKQVMKDNIPGMPASTSKNDLQWQAWLDEHGPRFPYLAALSDYRRANKHFQSLDTLVRRADSMGIFRYSMKYCGAAATGRWSGGDGSGPTGRQMDTGFNIQNITKTPYFDIPIRPMFVARPGCKLIVVDLKQIEPRCAAYMTRNWEFLDQVKAGMDVYEAHARATMGYTDPRPLSEVDNALRQVAKIRVLQLGYGTGAVGFLRTAQLYGLPMSEAGAQEAVNNFRAAHPNVVQFWNSLQEDYEGALGGTCEIELPTGRVMKYFDVRREQAMKFGRPGLAVRCTTLLGDNKRADFWGAKLFENFIQGLARDVFAWKLIEIARAGIWILWHVHDEVVCEVREEKAADALETIFEIMRREDPRLPGLPLDADGGIYNYYAK